MRPESKLFETNFELCKEWDYTKNSPLTPKDISYGSSKKVWWKCKKGHEWEASINSRTNLLNGCPYCSNQAVCKNNCLATTNPSLAKEWHPVKNKKLTPYDITSGSSKIVWWQCKKGHQWEERIDSRNKKNKKIKCQYCRSFRVSKDHCLAISNFELAKEWHPTKNGKLTPCNVMPYSGKMIWWKCRICGNEWKTSVNNRNGRGRGCNKCKKYKVYLIIS